MLIIVNAIRPGVEIMLVKISRNETCILFYVRVICTCGLLSADNHSWRSTFAY